MLGFDLDRPIRVHEGHEGGGINRPRLKVHWRGTLGSYWNLHAHLSLADMRRLAQALDRDGFHNVGGGPAALAYVVKPDAS